MSRNGNRWYVLGRVVPVAGSERAAIPEGTEYEFVGWSRTKEACISRRDKLDREGRQGIHVFAAGREEAARGAIECYGVKVRGYMDREEKMLGRQIVKAAVMREIFCPFSGVILDMRRAIVVEGSSRSFVVDGKHWDSLGDRERAEIVKRSKKVYDGRMLFKR